MRFHPKHWSLATKWSLVLTALALGPLLGVIRFNYSSAAQITLEKTVLALANGAADSATVLDDALGERIRQATYLSNLPAVRAFAAAGADRNVHLLKMRDDLKMVQGAYPYLESIEVLDGAGKVIYSTTGRQGDYGATAVMRTLAAGKIYVAGLTEKEADGEPSLVIAAPVATGGALRLQTSAKDLMNRVSRDGHRQGAGTLGLLLGENSEVIASSDGLMPGERVILGNNGSLTRANGERYAAQTGRLEAQPWTYVLAIPEAQIQAEVEEQRNQSIVLAVGASLVIGGLSRLLALRLTRPLTDLARASRALAGGDLTYQLKMSGKEDEVGQLQNAFDDAYKQLRKLVARMRLSSHLVAEASEHLHVMTTGRPEISSTMTTASEKLSAVARDLERQVAHFRV